jgi:IS5 family transposase
MQSKAVAFPTDARLMHRARERLVRLAKKTGVSLRQSYERVGKPALIAHQRYAHAKQFKRANRALRTIQTYLGRVCRDLVRKTSGEDPLRAIFAQPCRSPLPCASSVSISAGEKSIPCTRPRSNASARACPRA